MNGRMLLTGLLALLAALPGCGGVPAAAPKASALTLRYEEVTQIEVESPTGVRVMVDVLYPERLSRPATAQDILVTTTERDPNATGFTQSFPGQKLVLRAGELKSGDMAVTVIPSAQGPGHHALPENGSNYLVLIESGDMRIAHFGLIGQDSLTPEQLDALGRVDVAVAPLYVPLISQMSLLNKKGFNLVDQVRPALVIPTQIDVETAQYAVEHWAGAYAERPALTLTREMLPEKTTIVFMGDMGAGLGKTVGVPAFAAGDEEP